MTTAKEHLLEVCKKKERKRKRKKKKKRFGEKQLLKGSEFLLREALLSPDFPAEFN